MNEKIASQFKLRAAALAVASCLSMLPGFADAAGLGKITVFSGLGQPLRAEVEVSATRDELAGMTARLAPQEAFRQANIELAGGLADLRFHLDKRPNGTAVIRVSSSRPVNEPFLDFLVELNWPAGRLVREYTFLLDPPEVAAKSAGQPISVAEAKSVAGVADRIESEAAVQPRPAPAEPAARPRAAESAPKKAEAGATHVVRPGETLRKIASENQHEGVSLEQMLIGFLRANSDAFIAGNINRMRTGAILTIPERETVAAIPDSQAKMEYRTQAANWNAYRQKLAAAAAQAPAREDGGSQAAGGKITAKVEDKVAAEAPKDQVKVTRSDAAAKAAAGGRGIGDEELIAKDKALKEAQERLAQLEKNLVELQKLVEMKNQSLAELQKQADAKGKEAPPAPAAKPVEPPPPVEAPKPAEAPKPVEESAKAPAPAAAPAPEMPKPIEPAAPKPAAPPAPAPEPEPEVPFLDDETLLPLAGGGAIAALLAAYMVLRRRRTDAAAGGAAPAPQPFSLAPNSVFRATGGQSVDTSATTPPSTDFSQTGPGTIDTDEVDPVAEADVYMAYGRDAQAEEILLEAMQKDPQRTAIHVKLLEIYAARKSLKQFDTLASELYSQTGGTGPDWEKVAAMGARLDPANPLYSAAAAPAQPVDGDATLVAMPEDFLKTALVDAPAPAAEPAEEETEFPALDLEPAPLAFQTEEKQPEAAAPVDLDFDLGDIAPPSAPAEPPKAEPEVEKTAESVTDALDFDLGPAIETPPPPAPPAAAPAAEPEPVASFDFDFDLGEVEPPPAEPKPAEVPAFDAEATLVAADLEELAAKLQAPEADEGVIEFDIDIGQVEAPTAVAPETEELAQEEQAPEEERLAEEKPEEGDIGAADEDGLEFDLQLGDAALLGEPAQLPSFDLGAISLDLANEEEGGAVEALVVSEPPAEEILRDAHWEEVNTKLDLAKAYEEMGDLEGARELLQEVLQEGSPDLAEQAQAILGRLNA